MAKIASIKELESVAGNFKKDLELLVDPNNPDGFVLIKVAMATCSKAAGADKIYQLLSDYVEKRGINAVVTKTGCMGYCYAEPTIEVTRPGENAIVFSDVDEHKADEIIEKYIKNGDAVEGIIPLNYLTIKEV